MILKGHREWYSSMQQNSICDLLLVLHSNDTVIFCLKIKMIHTPSLFNSLFAVKLWNFAVVSGI